VDFFSGATLALIAGKEQHRKEYQSTLLDSKSFLNIFSFHSGIPFPFLEFLSGVHQRDAHTIKANAATEFIYLPYRRNYSGTIIICSL